MSETWTVNQTKHHFTSALLSCQRLWSSLCSGSALLRSQSSISKTHPLCGLFRRHFLFVWKIYPLSLLLEASPDLPVHMNRGGWYEHQLHWCSVPECSSEEARCLTLLKQQHASILVCHEKWRGTWRQASQQYPAVSSSQQEVIKICCSKG